MPISSFLQVPPAPIVLAAFFYLAVLLRWSPAEIESSPSFFVSTPNYVKIELSGSGLTAGVYQFNDGLTALDVIKLKALSSGNIPLPEMSDVQPVFDGARYAIVKKDQKIEIVQRGWMSAGKRIALGIALHPDRMNRSDWFVLPGIGMKLAERIHRDRQKNGDFGSLEALKRVNGIGPGRIESWKMFFSGV